MKRSGVTLLETMVALVILGLVVTGFLEVLQGSNRLARDSETWTIAVAYAEDAMESLKLGDEVGSEQLAGGFRRHVEVRPWLDRIRLVRVVVSLPGGGEVALDRLVEER